MIKPATLRKDNPLLSARHKSATRAFGYALKLGDFPNQSAKLAQIWAIRLTRCEAAGVLAASIAACRPADGCAIMDKALTDLSPGSPLPAFGSIASEAESWAALAPTQELRAYLPAVFSHLPARDRQLFLAAASRKVAA